MNEMQNVPQMCVQQVSLAATSGASSRSATDLTHAHWLLKDISFVLNRGDRLGLVGASGSGKTSLLRLLNRLSEPTRGAIALNDRPLAQIPIIPLRQQVVLVLQESKLLGMTVQESLEYPLLLRHLDRQTMRQRISEWMERLQIPADWLPRTEVQLSVGQRQLVAIARALATQPKVLLLDEPTSALDVGRSDYVLKVLVELAEQQETTIVFVSHQLELVKRFCTRILHLQAGMVIQDQPTSEIDWDMLRQQIVDAEVQQQSEWE